MKKQNKKTIDDLNKCYKEAEQADSEVFAEQRSNLMLVAGDHFSKRNSAFWNRVRDSKNLSSNQKLRLTKNHIYKISKIRKNLILSHASGVRVFPNNESELQDIKAAELNQSVWEYGKKQLHFRELTRQFVSDFFDAGEVACKIYFDESKGDLVAYEQAMDANGELEFDEMGEPVSSGRGIFSGKLCVERILPFNLLRAPDAKTMEDSPYLIVRKVIDKKTAEAMVGDDEDKKKMLSQGKDETYLVFDTNKSSYTKEENVVTLREHYYRPCQEYPDGYFYITTEAGILFEGELPYGIFPICYKGHDEMATTPRHRSPIKQARPYQIEINRASSKIAEHQITLGDDKLVVQNGAKVTSGSILPGVRAIQVSGMAPTVLPGRSGDQYFSYVDSQITELYNVMMVPEDKEEKGGEDAWASLWKSVRHKKRFILDAEKFEDFLVDVCTTYLDLAKNYFDENTVVPMVGRSEIVNISEFKNTESISYQIKVEPASDDTETVMGKQLMLNHILQYSSGQLEKEDIGRLIRMMPLANNEKSFEDLTMSFDRASNIILALDRGDFVEPNKYDDGPYIVKRLTTRMSQSDFRYLDPQIQQNYQSTVQIYEEMEVEKAQQLKAMQSDFIPTDGAMIKVQWYVKDPKNPNRSIQATLPARSIEWLVERLKEQGTTQDSLLMNGQGQHDITKMYNEAQGLQQQQQQPAMAPGEGLMPSNEELLAKLRG